MDLEAIKESVHVFCRLNGIDPEGSSALEFYEVIMSEMSGLVVGKPGCARLYLERHAPQRVH